MSATCGIDSRFAVQKIDHGSWKAATTASLAIDYLFGHKDVVNKFFGSAAGEEFNALRRSLDNWTVAELQQFVAREKRRSLLFLVMMMTGACNADCEICFTDRRAKRGETTPELRDDLLRQARELGARFVYVPGEGEPTIDKGFWAFLESCRRYNLEAIIFTNGLVLASEEACNKYWQTSIDQAITRLANYPVSFYFKWWTTNPLLASTMLRVDPRHLPYSRYDSIDMPSGLVTLLDKFPRHRVGIETVIEARNVREVEETIIPFAQEHGLARIIELIQHNGRMLGDGRFG